MSEVPVTAGGCARRATSAVGIGSGARSAVRLLWVAAAFCTTAAATGVPATRLPDVRVAGEIAPDQLAQADAASAGVVTQDQIESRPISRPAEVLEFVPGLIATQHSGDGKANQYFLRGFNLDHGTDFATYVDGVPNNLRTHAHGQGYNDLNGLIPELLDTIEYRKGPYYAEDGDFSSAGSARLRYIDSLDRPIYQISFGEHGYTRGLLAGSVDAGGEHNLLLALDAGVYDGPWDRPEDEKRVSMLAKWLGGTADDGYRVEFMGYHNRWNSSDQIPLRAVEEGLIDRFGQIDDDLGGETGRYTLAGDYHRAIGDGYLLANAYFSHYSLDLYSDFTYFLDDPERGDQFEQSDRRNYYGGTAKYVTRWRSGSIEHSLSVGADLRIDDIGRVGLYHTEARGLIGTVREDSVTESSLGGFLSYETRWSPWLRTVAGLRYDYYHADVDSNVALNSGDADDHRPSPKFSAIFGPWKNTELFLNAGRGFHSNDARGATLRVDPTDPEQAASALRLLVPSRGEEIGLRLRPTPTVSASLALWRLSIGSELVFSGDGGTTEPSYPSRRHGLELSAYWQALSWLLVDADFATSHARFRGNPEGDRIPNAIERVASVGIVAQGPGRWFGSLRYRYLGPAPLIEDNSVRSHSTKVVNAAVGYAFKPSLRLSVEALNLFDSKDYDITYFYESQLANESEAVPDIHFHPVEPRQIRLVLRGQF